MIVSIWQVFGLSVHWKLENCCFVFGKVSRKLNKNSHETINQIPYNKLCVFKLERTFGCETLVKSETFVFNFFVEVSTALKRWNLLMLSADLSSKQRKKNFSFKIEIQIIQTQKQTFFQFRINYNNQHERPLLFSTQNIINFQNTLYNIFLTSESKNLL